MLLLRVMALITTVLFSGMLFEAIFHIQEHCVLALFAFVCVCVCVCFKLFRAMFILKTILNK